ncbi:MAG: CoxG family protein [bacterium]
MQIEGTHTFNCSRVKFWDFIMDPEVIGQTIPGCSDFKSVAEDEFEAQITIGIAAVKGVYTSKISLEDKNPPVSYKLKIQGKGARGFLHGEVTIQLKEDGGNTILHYASNNQIGGAIAGIGQRIVGAAAKMLINQSFKSLEKQLQKKMQS